jgi:hypothetical protein
MAADRADLHATGARADLAAGACCDSSTHLADRVAALEQEALRNSVTPATRPPRSRRVACLLGATLRVVVTVALPRRGRVGVAPACVALLLLPQLHVRTCAAPRHVRRRLSSCGSCELR